MRSKPANGHHILEGKAVASQWIDGVERCPSDHPVISVGQVRRQRMIRVMSIYDVGFPPTNPSDELAA
jgi:hypothetical protein